uniref:GATOR1 complex protein NPRL3 C-terminal HTH domain-containing protein n=1 Tax=Mucochytrium quahogii TaxID=96639 RepID=A0A7S2W4G6_9STRA|mmetsp:Transcript_1210/g.2561  ORF Transcript_1210/g.2561 Transcript_1210/m.2561 type:complete len:684 (+) Transcript_1210:344-2395(+)
MLGIALVVEDVTKGQKLAFRYPGPKMFNDGYEMAAAKGVENKFSRGGKKKKGSRKRAAMLKDFWRFDQEIFAKLFRPTTAQCGNLFELVIDDLRFLSYPVLIDRENTNRAKRQLTMFSLIFVLDAESEKVLEHSRFDLGVKPCTGTYGVAYPGSADSIEMYRRAAMKLAAGMLYEENQCGYISEQVDLMFAWNDVRGVKAPPKTENQTLSTAPGQGTLGNTMKPPHDPVSSSGESAQGQTDTKRKSMKSSLLAAAHASLEATLKRSELARELKKVFIGLSETGSVECKLHGRVRLALTLQNPVLHPTSPLRPYQTILLFDDKTKQAPDMTRQLNDSSTQLNQLVQFAKKYGAQKSFEDISLGLNVPIQEVFRISAHLLYWRKGRIIDALHSHNVYWVSPNAVLDPASRAHYDFQKKFACTINVPIDVENINESNIETQKPTDSGPDGKQWTRNGVTLTVSLLRILEMFCALNSQGAPKTFSQIVQDAKIYYDLNPHKVYNMTTWLLQHDFIVQLQRYFYLVVPKQSTKGPKKVRAGDTRPVGTFGSSAAELAAAVAQAADKAVAAEAQAAEAQAAQSMLSSQAVHALQTADPSLSSDTLFSISDDFGDMCALEKKHGKKSLPPSKNTRGETAFLDAIATDSDTYRLFRRLTPYFYGRHCENEIIWRENITRESLNKVVKTYTP